MKRKIICFLTGPKGARERSESPEVYTASDGREYCVVIVEGGYSPEEDCILPEDAIAVWGTADFIEENVLVGRKVLV